MGRRKIEIEPIKDDRNRTVTFIKRKAGLFKKAHELSVLCQVDIAVIILGSNNTFYEYSSVDMSNLITVHQNNADLPHNVIEPSDYGDYVKKPRVVLSERKRRRRRATVLQPDSNSGSSTISSQDSSGVQEKRNLSVPMVSNDIGNTVAGNSLIHMQGSISGSVSSNSGYTSNNVNYPMLQDYLHSGGSFYANNYKENNGQQPHANEVAYTSHMNKRIRLGTHSLLPGTNKPNYGNFYPSPYDNLPKPPLASSLMGNIPPIQSQFVQVIPGNSNPIGRSFNGTGDSVTFETRQKIPPKVTVSNASDGPAPVQTMVHHLNQLNRNRERLSEKPSLTLNIPKVMKYSCQKSPVPYSFVASPKTDVQSNTEHISSSIISSPFSHSAISAFRSNDINESNHNSRSAGTHVNNETFFLKPPIGRPPKFPKSPSSSIVIFPSSVTNPSLKPQNQAGSPD
ncbi:hypothetical protein SKDZ_02G2890 [Saccharomyces kudriavzevii ZP591]|nr:hypothetical protein SKDZ_02G2890 [Saccharomyces kudriavzevii ZP591]